MRFDPKVQISKYFTYKEALWLPSWQKFPEDSEIPDEIINNLKQLFTKMDVVRDFFSLPINVHVALRTILYNQIVKGASNSAHIHGLAVDFDVHGLSCDDVKDKILSNHKLEEWNMRMEDNGKGAKWIHLDLNPPNPNRFFKP